MYFDQEGGSAHDLFSGSGLIHKIYHEFIIKIGKLNQI